MSQFFVCVWVWMPWNVIGTHIKSVNHISLLFCQMSYCFIHFSRFCYKKNETLVFVFPLLVHLSFICITSQFVSCIFSLQINNKLGKRINILICLTKKSFATQVFYRKPEDPFHIAHIIDKIGKREWKACARNKRCIEAKQSTLIYSNTL